MDEAWTDGRVAPGAPVEIRKISVGDLREALGRGWQDFLATPTQLVFLCILYPIVGLVAARAMSGGELLPLLYPLIAGLALVGPVAAVGLYEISRRREAGHPAGWLNAFDVLHSPALFSIAMVGVLLMAIFIAWLTTARAIFDATIGSTPASITDLVRLVFSTPQGYWLLLLGNGIGFLFAVAVLILTVVSVPMLLDRNPGVGVAIQTSIRTCLKNPVPMAVWGLIVAVLLLLGSLPAFIGLAVVMPLLGHATWHVYRRVVA
jgi:uncharacterized membrane protein